MVIGSLLLVETTILQDSLLACIGSKLTIHLPCWSAFAVFFWPACGEPVDLAAGENSTVTSLPASPQPQTGTGLLRWITILSLNSDGRLNSEP